MDHAFVVVNPVEETVQVEVHHPVLSALDVGPCRPHRVGRAAVRSEPIAVFAKLGLPPGTELLVDGRLEQAVLPFGPWLLPPFDGYLRFYGLC